MYIHGSLLSDILSGERVNLLREFPLDICLLGMCGICVGYVWAIDTRLGASWLPWLPVMISNLQALQCSKHHHEYEHVL